MRIDKIKKIKLLSYDNAKTRKGEKLNWLTAIMYLAPHTIVKGINVCKFASKGCKTSCLFTAGMGVFPNVKQARVNRTKLLRDNKDQFFAKLHKEIKSFKLKSTRNNQSLCIRLNGTSDISWEFYVNNKGKNIFELFPRIQFYDYTKNFTRNKALKGHWSNYHLTFSLSESNFVHASKLLNQNINVAAVFDKLPKNYNGHLVLNGDDNDLRFLNPSGVYIGLIAKGRARKDQSGFVQRIM